VRGLFIGKWGSTKTLLRRGSPLLLRAPSDLGAGFETKIATKNSVEKQEKNKGQGPLRELRSLKETLFFPSKSHLILSLIFRSFMSFSHLVAMTEIKRRHNHSKLRETTSLN